MYGSSLREDITANGLLQRSHSFVYSELASVLSSDSYTFFCLEASFMAYMFASAMR